MKVTVANDVDKIAVTFDQNVHDLELLQLRDEFTPENKPEQLIQSQRQENLILHVHDEDL